MVGRGRPAEEIRETLREMGRVQAHRGPDDRRECVYDYGNVSIGFGFVRLSILDLETGMQPIRAEADDTAIICNGQIYNHPELKEKLAGEIFRTRGDVETALHLYRRKGIDFLQDLNGMYAGAIFDPRRGRLFLFRDRFGIKPLYYAEQGGRFYFSSEIKPLLAAGIEARPGTDRLAEWFTYRYLPGGNTLFSGIRKLPPGSYLDMNLRDGSWKIVRYWELRFGEGDSSLSEDEAADEIARLFSDAVRIRLRSDVEVGSLLSGGIDSSAVASKAAEFQPDLRLFTIGFEERKYDESADVRAFLAADPMRFGRARPETRLCAREALHDLPELVRAVEEPIVLAAMLPTDRVCHLASDRVKVALTGEGADEIFAGYRKFMLEMAAGAFKNASETEREALLRDYPELVAYLPRRHPDPARRYIQSEALFAPEELARLLNREITEALPPEEALPVLRGDEHPLDAMQAMECRFRLPDYVILRLDKLSMRHSLETRTPFLDYRLAEFAAGLPDRYKANLPERREKNILRRAFRRAGILNEGGALRPKQLFTAPLARWLSDPDPRNRPDFLREILEGDEIHRQGILDPGMVKELAASIRTQTVGPETLVSSADQVFGVVIFTLWNRIFMETTAGTISKRKRNVGNYANERK